MFTLLDADKDGLITSQDLERAIVEFGKLPLHPDIFDLRSPTLPLSLIGETVTPDELKEMIMSADVDGDGMINYEEFLKVMVSLGIGGV